MKELYGKQVQLYDAEQLRRERENRAYMMELDSACLLQSYAAEAGRGNGDAALAWSEHRAHGGWESPYSQLRGHFLGHWLSAAAMYIAESGDAELAAKTEAIVQELACCQQDNGGEWVASIPEKYLTWIARGKNVWAPHYTVHKTFMGLLDLYEYTGHDMALQIARHFADWFLRYSDGFTREQMDDILDYETGGMLEIWAQLYGITHEVQYRTLMERYYRGRLFDRLLAGEDVLTNMHANTTIPEVLGCARAYEVTGEERWRKIVEAYWREAVTERGTYATGGQTCGEVWTPKKQLAARLGAKNQEHCSVYNMMRLANYLLQWTEDPRYADYIERNLYNGIMAQGYWRGSFTHGQKSEHPDSGLLTYFLPLSGTAGKAWASKRDDFFCCHGTLVQANAAANRHIFYQMENRLFVCQYLDAAVEWTVGETRVRLAQKQDTLSGSFHLTSDSPVGQAIHANTLRVQHDPDLLVMGLELQFEQAKKEGLELEILLRIPDWLSAPATVWVNGEVYAEQVTGSRFLSIARRWQPGDQIRLQLPRGIYTVPLPDDPDRVAFCYGPQVLAGIGAQERLLHTHGQPVESLLVHDNEREWGRWTGRFRLTGQETGMQFVPLWQIGYERYQVYFPISQG